MEQEEKQKVFLVHIGYHPSCMVHPSVGGVCSLCMEASWRHFMARDWFHSTLHGSFMEAFRGLRLVPLNSAWKLHGGIISWRLSVTPTEVSWGHAFGKASFHDSPKYLG